MFRKLRTKITLGISLVSLILLAFFSLATYHLFLKSASNFIPADAPSYSPEVSNIIDDRIEKKHQDDSIKLKNTLIISSFTIELLVIILASIFSKKIVRPVEANYEAEKSFVANSAHELKTPIASISANLEAAALELSETTAELKSQVSSLPKKHQIIVPDNLSENQFLSNARFETDRLAQLNSDLLTLSRLDAEGAASPKTKSKEKSKEFDLKTLIKKSVKLKLPVMSGKSITLIGKPVKIKSYEHSLDQLFDILLDNAIKYSEKTITIRFAKDFIEIENDGAVIPTESLPHIFERFYQVDKNHDGVGLGLSIARSIAENHKWKLTASTTKTTTKFRLVL